jgi:hypothetical protein
MYYLFIFPGPPSVCLCVPSRLKRNSPNFFLFPPRNKTPFGYCVTYRERVVDGGNKTLVTHITSPPFFSPPPFHGELTTTHRGFWISRGLSELNKTKKKLSEHDNIFFWRSWKPPNPAQANVTSSRIRGRNDVGGVGGGGIWSMAFHYLPFVCVCVCVVCVMIKNCWAKERNKKKGGERIYPIPRLCAANRRE